MKEQSISGSFLGTDEELCIDLLWLNVGLWRAGLEADLCANIPKMILDLYNFRFL